MFMKPEEKSELSINLRHALNDYGDNFDIIEFRNSKKLDVILLIEIIRRVHKVKCEMKKEIEILKRRIESANFCIEVLSKYRQEAHKTLDEEIDLNYDSVKIIF